MVMETAAMPKEMSGLGKKRNDIAKSNAIQP